MGKISRRLVLQTGGMVAAGAAVGGVRLLGQNSSVAPAAAASSTVRTPLGDLRGSLGEGGVRVFKGVPFAEPAVGALRFRPPVRAKGWTGVRDATSFGSPATQFADAKRQVEGSEDCLYLNIWAPAGPGPSPVYVWIHGGGFTGGRATEPVFDGTEFARDGIVFVTVAYRLGVFGFLDLGPLLGTDYAGSGNNGMRDLVMALRWVHENIAAFGGDPGRVTVGGESAGAKATAALMAIPEAQDLFQSMISESGGGERVWGLADAQAVAREYGAAFAEAGVPGAAASGAMLPALKTASAAALIWAQEQLTAGSARHFPFRSEVDGSYLTARPVDVVAKGSSRGKRLLIGTNRDESALFLGPHPATDPKRSDLGNLPLAAFDNVFAKYASLYPEMPTPQRRVRAVTAEEYWVPSIRLADAHVAAGGTAWMYRLDYTNAAGRFAGEAYHSEDIRLVFDKPDGDEDAAGAALGRGMHAAWIAFIKGGSPMAEGPPTWPEYGSADRRTVMLDRTSHVEQQPAEAELRLWDGVL